MRTFWLIPATILVAAGLGLAASESRISSKAADTVEDLVNDKLRVPGADAYDLLGPARCTYVDGYGVVITLELQLVFAANNMPFRAAYSPQEVAAVRDRELKKLPLFKETLHELMAGSASTLDSLPLNQRIAIEARLFHFGWEDSKGVPGRIFMSAEKSKLLAAKANPAALAAAIEEQDQ